MKICVKKTGALWWIILTDSHQRDTAPIPVILPTCVWIEITFYKYRYLADAVKKFETYALVL